MTCNKIQTSKICHIKLQFSGEAASAESGTRACIICSGTFHEDWIGLSCGGWTHESWANTKRNILQNLLNSKFKRPKEKCFES
jgi:hypothetical protein